MAEAYELENSDFSDAIDGVVMFRLNRHARALEVAKVLHESSELAPCRALVYDAGCELRPDCAGGAWLFLLITQGQIEEAKEHGLRGRTFYHILMLARFEDAMRRALKAVPGRMRPHLKHVSPSSAETPLKGDEDDVGEEGEEEQEEKQRKRRLRWVLATLTV